MEDNGATAMRVVIEPEKGAVSDISYYLVHDTSQQKVRRFGNYETDARCAYVERDGRGKSGTAGSSRTEPISRICPSDLILFQAREQVSQLGFRRSTAVWRWHLPRHWICRNARFWRIRAPRPRN